MRHWLLAVLLVPVTACSVLVDDECGASPPDGCSQAECVTDPANPDYGSCGGNLYSCVAGSWERVGYCEPNPLRPTGVWSLDQQLSTGSTMCMTSLTVPANLTVEVASAGWAEYEVTTAPEDVMVNSLDVQQGFQGATAQLDVSDIWLDGGVDVTAAVSYALSFAWNGTISGTATASAGTCNVTLSVTGTRSP